MIEFALFDTPIGRCGIAWDGDAIEGVQLPESRVADTRDAGCRTASTAAAEARAAAGVQDAIDRMVASLRGEADDLVDVPARSRRAPHFQRKVFEVVRTIPPARRCRTARSRLAAGSPGAARAVGQALGRNPYPIVVPCHRVLGRRWPHRRLHRDGGVAVKEDARRRGRDTLARLRGSCSPRRADAAPQPRQSVRPAAARNAATMPDSSSSAADGSSGSLNDAPQVGEPGGGERGHLLHGAVEVERAVVGLHQWAACR